VTSIHLTVCVSLLVVAPVFANQDMVGVADSNRARVNYMLNCQGCHGPGGAGTADGAVPTLQQFVGKFLHVPGGREFLVRVPGSANAALSNAELAEVLNWMLHTISPSELPGAFQPYTETEVGPLRKEPMADVLQVREGLVRLIEASEQER
jgi:mono/diheme cytochrome c family protein